MKDKQQPLTWDGQWSLQVEADRLRYIYQYGLDNLIHLLILSWVGVLFVDGYLSLRMGFQRLETVYYLLLLSLLSARTMLKIGISRFIMAYLVFLVMAVVTGIVLCGPTVARLSADLRYLLRSVVIGLSVFWYYSTTPWISYRNIRILFTVYWSSVTILVLLHYAFGIGGVMSGTGQLKVIYTSYFITSNIVIFSYLIAWFHLYVVNTGKIYRAALTVVSLGIAVLMSSKALLLMIIGLFGLFHIWSFAHRSSGRKIFMLSMFVAILAALILFWSDIWIMLLTLFAKISPDGATILFKMKVMDLLTVLVSTRNVKLLSFLDTMQHQGVTEWLFGLGAADAIDGKELIESDPFDLLKFYGFVGVGLFALLICAAWRLMVKQRQLRKKAFEFYLFAWGTLTAALIVSVVTGHIFTAPGAMIMLGLVFGTLASERLRLEIESYWTEKRSQDRSVRSDPAEILVPREEV